MSKPDLIGVINVMQEHIKPEYVSLFTKKTLDANSIRRTCKNLNEPDTLYMLAIYENKKTGISAKRTSFNEIFGRPQKPMTLNEKNRLAKLEKKLEDPKYRVDTSKWVMPDKESILRQLKMQLFSCELLKEGNFHYDRAKIMAMTLYWILQSKSPKNPQGFTNYSVDFPLDLLDTVCGFKRRLWMDVPGEYTHKQICKRLHAWKMQKMKAIIR